MRASIPATAFARNIFPAWMRKIITAWDRTIDQYSAVLERDPKNINSVKVSPTSTADEEI
jgi:hypothetical protein